MQTILVTGRIASGKSEACRYLVSKGYPVYDSDSRTKALYENVDGLKQRLEKELGIEFGSLGRIFSDREKLLRLESIVYPLVLEDFREWASRQDGETVFFESAIAGEKAAFDGVFDRTILVKAPLATRLARNPKVQDRDAFQNPEGHEADFIIENDRDKEYLYGQLDNILNKI